jgi:hypothetical protein
MYKHMQSGGQLVEGSIKKDWRIGGRPCNRRAAKLHEIFEGSFSGEIGRSLKRGIAPRWGVR